MTEQIPDTCTFDGRQWTIEEWLGPTECVPPNESLGIRTTMDTTANWSGRIDHFLVWRGRLYLFKVEVNLVEEDKDLVPPGARKEVNTRYQVMEHHGSNGLYFHNNVIEQVFFVYDDIEVDFTGELLLSYPVWDPWNLPWPVEGDELDPDLHAVLRFEDGLLEEISDSW